MDTTTLLLFSATVLPLICTPGPDMIFIASQAIAGGKAAGLRATAGIVLGYSIHALLVALGLAAVVRASPMLFETIRWVGVAYLLYLACKLIRSALNPGGLALQGAAAKGQLTKGLLTALLNPKGMMVYIAILPQFMSHTDGNVTLQAVALSATFMFWCALVYTAMSLLIGRMSGGVGSSMSSTKRRSIDGAAGGMILLAAGYMAQA